MQNILNKIYESKYLNQEESYQLFKLISFGKITDIKLSSILTAMKIRGESKEEIIGAILAFSENIKYFPRPDYLFADIVGTGGDIKNTMNISTASAFVASSCGLKIVKHCNQGVSSKSGSSDLLKRFNINLYASSQKSRQTLDKLNICFLFAPKYHDSFHYSRNVRKILKTRTIFNLLGPFLNPAIPPFSVIGVYSKNLVNSSIEILKNLKYKRGIVLHGHDTDEVTLHGTTYVAELFNEKISSYKLQPKDFGLEIHDKKIFIERSSKENYHIISEIMKGKGDRLNEELIAVNVAMLLKIFGYEDLKENTKLALNKIRSGDVYKHIINVANMLKEDEHERNNT
ncbi:MAG: anthranilate phosphoribosyltransferase [Buchnera aphidicola (Brevicoryne brassicae)]|uniref:Anthranilate phosphoribosyltransferase n=1 Tax=Buchnera aphidicola (Brevicoryne brassicae) TaxID=911343 RepID=A0AAJ5TXW1_9GAMM|nr:anthranilate phosphoribosyltransferase [Buchnera aphidicola]QCI19843.1 anthranilate phosphoribosyltransferase [Buchnera aphidicola (Brevicoryne brassicae)]WAI19220.1 MAG: anthranilate phosphoribosyltransferase [Buchnera aphidicola (Brevicoryne brassicae)]